MSSDLLETIKRHKVVLKNIGLVAGVGAAAYFAVNKISQLFAGKDNGGDGDAPQNTSHSGDKSGDASGGWAARIWGILL